MTTTPTRTGTAFGLLLIALACVASGCRHKVGSNPGDPSDDDETTFAEDGADASGSESDAELLASSLVSSSASGGVGLASVELDGADLGTRTLGDGAKAIYLPRNCLDVTADATAQSVTYDFKSCLVGPNGLANVQGQVIARYRTAPGKLHLDINANDLHVNGAVLDYHATADVTAEGTMRDMVWSAQLTGTTAGKRDFSRTSSQKVSWTVGEACFALEGTSEGQIRKRDIKVEISNFKRCRRGCPEAGGVIKITNVAKGKTVELDYDGTSSATFIGPRGGKIDVPLLCRG